MNISRTPAKTTVQDRMKFIEENCPEIENINPYTDYIAIKKVKYKLFDAGFYTNDSYKYSANVDSSIIKMIDRIQAQRLAAKKIKLTK